MTEILQTNIILFGRNMSSLLHHKLLKMEGLFVHIFRTVLVYEVKIDTHPLFLLLLIVLIDTFNK